MVEDEKEIELPLSLSLALIFLDERPEIHNTLLDLRPEGVVEFLPVVDSRTLDVDGRDGAYERAAPTVYAFRAVELHHLARLPGLPPAEVEGFRGAGNRTSPATGLANVLVVFQVTIHIMLGQDRFAVFRGRLVRADHIRADELRQCFFLDEYEIRALDRLVIDVELKRMSRAHVLADAAVTALFRIEGDRCRVPRGASFDDFIRTRQHTRATVNASIPVDDQFESLDQELFLGDLCSVGNHAL